MFGLVFAPEEAVRRGLVHRCADDALETALAMAHVLCSHPAATLAHIKRLVCLARKAEPEMLSQQSGRCFATFSYGRPVGHDR